MMKRIFSRTYAALGLNWWKSTLAIVFIFGVLYLLLFTARPDTSKLNTTSGIVADIYEGGAYDIVFKISETNQEIYINRGLEEGFSIAGLKVKTLGKEIEVVFFDQKPLISIGGNAFTMYRLKLGEEELYHYSY